ncbi:class I SAM-dependent methyltransferase [Microvirga calopogonii]|uniref:class I SAM-dependent methyltransferase n=1 Tax=Microvirga calopogonii TaxID=2078013 RepID=UPI002479404E|nr:class I SAM-dependent methyltransferase [Microvirga calopogonii]
MTGFNPRLFDSLVEFERHSFWFVNRARLLTSLIARYFPAAQDMLEIGCGTGSVLLALRERFPTLRLSGSELHPQGLAYARKRLGDEVLLLQMDARRIPATGQFDVIGAFDVIEHIPEDEDVLSEIQTALRPGGGAIIAVPQHPNLWSPADDAAFHQRRYARGELEQKLHKAGFEVLHSTSFNTFLLPLMILSRRQMIWKERKGARLDPLSEFRMKDWLNRTLSVILGAEVHLTEAGVKWPVGGSRVVVARRL